MSTLSWCIVVGLFCSAVFFLAGWYLRPSMSAEEKRKLVCQELEAMLSQEDLEKSRRRSKAEMVAANRRSVPRTNAFGPARISKVSFSRPKKW